MDIRQENIPFCECHNEPMFWNKDERTPKKGYWRCFVIKRKYGIRDQTKYANSPKGYVKIRKRLLSGMRENILIKLKELEDGRRAI